MSLILDGTNGLSDVDGSASTPAIRGTDTNTGIFFPAADTIAFAEGGAEQMRLDSSGNLGLGLVPTGASGFSANKLLEIGGASGPAVIFRPSGSTSEHTVCGAGDGLVLGATGAATASNNAIRFFTSNTNSSTTPTERIRIDSAGDLLVGGTGQVSAGNAYVQLRGGDNNCIETYRVGTAVRNHIVFFNANGAVGVIQTSGSSTIYATSSDYRLKENIAPMTGALAKVSALKPVTYKWKSDGSDGQGFIAHELAEVMPDCVTGEKDAVENYTDENGIEKTRPTYQAIDTSFLVATLTAAIQELKAELDSVKAELATLKA